MKKILYLLLTLSLFSCLSDDDFERNQAELEQQQREFNEQLEKDTKIIEDYIKENGLDSVMTTRQGLHYKIIKPGEGENAKPNDAVVVTYNGRFLDGTVFDKTEEDKPVEFNITQRLIFGFAQGLTLLKPGGKATLLIPSGLGYGRTGRANADPVVKPNTILLFDIELLEIIN